MLLRLTIIGLLMAGSITARPQRLVTLNEESFKMIILHNNDMHARFEQTSMISGKCKKEEAANNKCYGGFARVAHEVKEFRKKAADGEIPPVIYLNAGDTYTGTPWFSLYKDEIASAFLKMLKPDAISLGNHEFDEGVDNLVKFMGEIDFPVLAANLDLDDEPELKAQPLLKPSLIITVGGQQVGIIGYLTPETKTVAIHNKVEFGDEIEAINIEAAKLKVAGVNVIIALGHSGYERDLEIAAGCPDIDLIIGGHSHTFLYTGQAPDWEKPEGDYPTIVTQSNGRKVPVVQAYAYTKYLGYIELEFDGAGELLQIYGIPILLNATVPRDSEVLALLETYRPGIIELEAPVGQTRVFLDGSCRRNECNLGNFLTDAFVDWYAVQYESVEFWTDASIAFLQGGGVRASIDHKSSGGEITKEDANTVMPFNNTLEVIELTGVELLAALEHSVHRYTDGGQYGEFLQMSGVQVVYDMNQPTGKRVVDAKVVCAKCQIPTLEAIDKTKTYKIIMQSYLADGGDGFEVFNGKTVMKTTAIDLDVFTDYLKKKSPIYPAVEWRITINNWNLPTEPEDVVGSTRVFLDSKCQQHECNLGNFITDAMVDWHAVHYEGDSWTDASIAIIQGSRIKASLTANHEITRTAAERIFQPAFFNLNLVSMTGNELVNLLEHSIYDVDNANNVNFLQMSGLQVVYDFNKPSGHRVIEVLVLCAECPVPQLEPLDRAKEYKVIMQSILASGADGFNSIIGTKLLEDLGESDVNVFLKYLAKKSPVYPAVEWRITMKPLEGPGDVVGSTRVTLDGKCRQEECNLGNFITDAMVDWHAVHYDGDDFWTDASIAVIQGSRIKASIDPKINDGSITRADAVKIFEPFYQLSAVTLTGAELVKLLEHSVSNFNDANNVKFLQVSGIQVAFDLTKPVGARVDNVQVLCAQCPIPQLEPLQDDQEYKVIMQSVLATGGDGFGGVIGEKLIEDLEVTDVNVFIEYLKKKSPVYPAVEWRITMKKPLAPSEDIIGSTRVFLDGACVRNECNLGNFVTDAMVDWYAVNHDSGEFWTDASIALIQGGSIRASIDNKVNDGIITKADALRVMPFGNKIEVVEVTGRALLDALEHAVRRYADGVNPNEFLQMSGVQVLYDVKRPAGQRVVEAKVLCANCQVPALENVDEQKIYRIVMQDYMANGNGGFDMFQEKSVVQTDIADVDTVVDYFKKKSPVYPAVEWRITFAGESDTSTTVTSSTVETTAPVDNITDPPTSPPTDSPTSPLTDSPTSPPTAAPITTDEPETTTGSANLHVSFVLILMTTILTFVMKR